MKRKDLLVGGRLALEAVKGVTALVEAVHMNVLDRAIGTPAVKPVRAITALVYRSIGAITGLAGKGLEQALDRAAPLLSGPGWEGRGPVLAALNGVIGDHLEQSGNGLAIRMGLAPAGASGARLAVMVHGLCMSGGQWLHDGVDHGAMLADEKDYTALYVDYNSGRHISDNGREFAALLHGLAARPEVGEIVIVAHSMGGLVVRSALLRSAPVPKLSGVVFLGTPHLGAPLERMGNWVNTIADLNTYSAPFSRLAKLRSAGITDLRHGSIDEADWSGRDRFARAAPGPLAALPAGVRFYAIAGVLGPGATDGLVPLDSALGRGTRGSLQFTATATLQETGHMDLLGSAGVADLLRQWL